MKGTLRRVALSGLLAASILALTTVAHAQTPSPEADGRGAPDAYRIGPEDQLLISVWKNDAMSRSVLVRPDGKIAMPLLNDVQAAGLTALELRDVLTTKLKEFIPNPEVTVIVSDVRSLKVSVIGEVARPGRYELRSWATVLDALALAGGFTQYASRSKIVILHPKGKSMEKIPFNYNEVSGKQENFYLRNGDIVLVP
jgi:polysaccharide export outer membrane protein